MYMGKQNTTKNNTLLSVQSTKIMTWFGSQLLHLLKSFISRL